MRKLIIILILFSIQTTFAQNISFTGYIKDLQYKEPLPFANIKIFYNGDSLFTNATADFDGKFVLKINPQKIKFCKIKVGYIGYFDTIIDNINFTSNVINIFLREDIFQVKSTHYCPHHNDSCDIYEFFYCYYKIPKRIKKKQEKEKRIILREMNISKQKYCNNKWYCKTHNTEY
jgi:hypothetical protein